MWKLGEYDEETGVFTAVATDTGTMLPSWSRDGKTMAWEVTRGAFGLWLLENFR